MFTSNIKNNEKSHLPTRNQQIYNHPFTIIAMLFSEYYWKPRETKTEIKLEPVDSPTSYSASHSPFSMQSEPTELVDASNFNTMNQPTRRGSF